MFSIASVQQQYHTYLLTDDAAPARLEVVPERGGIITRWQVQGRDLLYLDAARFADPNLSIRGGIPILFPICGNLPGNAYTHNGKIYTLKQHGFARDLPWAVVDQSTTDSAALVLTLESNDQTRAVYPFEFQLQFTYRLRGHGLEIHQRFTNRSTVAMPFSIGLHPYFQVTDKPQLQFDIPTTQFQNQIDQTTHPFTGQFDFNLDEIDVAFRPISRQTASTTDPQRQTRIVLEYDTLFAVLVFWTVKGKEYYCLEPWSAPRNALNTGEQLHYLEAGATQEATVRLKVEML